MLRTLRRLLLSASVIGLFSLYAFQQQMHPPTSAVSNDNSNPIVAAIVPSSTAPLVTIAPAVITADDDSLDSESHEDAASDDGLSRGSVTVPTVPPAIATTEPTAPFASSGVARTWNDGAYTGDSADASWGNVQVQVTIANDRITDVLFLTYPNHRNRSISINDSAMPILTQEAISAQSSRVDIVSGATDTSEAFIQSLDSALQQAAA